MKNNQFVCFILICSMICTVSFSYANTINTIIYVDDDNIEGPWDGSIEHPFQCISDGITASGEGDTVFVYGGTYDDNLIVDQSISLIGEEKNLPVINGGTTGDVILVSSSNVRVQGFFVTQDDSNQDAGIKIHGDSCYISRNVIDICNEGIYVEKSFNCTLEKNTITSGLIGIYLFASDNNMIQMNSISNCGTGIYIEESSKNIVSSNIIDENSRGVFSSYATENIIMENSFLNNEESSKFTKYLSLGFFKPNKWYNNYWDDWIGFGVKVIPGLLYIPINEDPIGYFFPWIEIDWNPISATH